MERVSKSIHMKRITRLMIIGAIVLALLFTSSTAFAANGYSNQRKMLEVLDILQMYHVSGPDEELLTEAAIEGMVEALGDPYTEYMSKERLDQFQSSIDQSYVGIGVRLGTDNKGFYVDEVFPDSPAAGVGLQRGDYITAVEGASTKSWKLEDLVSRITGKAGTKVRITVLRGSKSISVEMTRKLVQAPIVTIKKFTNGIDGKSIGYVKLDSFSLDAGDRVAKAIDDLKKDSFGSLVLDLRGNPGGYLQATADIAKQFIPYGVLIHTKDQNNIDNPIVIEDGYKFPYPLVILVDGGSASASEVLTGALQDYRVATVVGETTYGKGSVQTLLSLSDGSMLKVTIEEYLTPNKRPVNGVGIEPNVHVSGRTPQLIAALYTAGAKSIELKAIEHSLEINGAEVNDQVTMLAQDGGVYIPSRIAAAILKAEVVWDAASKSVRLEKGKTSNKFASGAKGSITKDGTSYIYLAELTKAFPGLQWSYEDKMLTVRYTEDR